MINVAVVDAGAKSLCAALNGISSREKRGITFSAKETIEQLFPDLETTAFDLILLHHHWEGTSITQILERIGRAQDTRVVVFTGQSINVHDLIECVRSGVADYWPKRGALEPLWVFRQIDQYCSSQQWTIKNLTLSSGAVRQLVSEAETNDARQKELVNQNRTLKDKVETLENQESTDIRRQMTKTIITLTYCAVVIATPLILSAKAPDLSGWSDLAFAALIAALILFLDGKVRELLLKWTGGSAHLK
jgi:ActR/RegA family two-component response regulator